MTFLDIIELYNITHDNDLDNMTALFADVILDERLDKDILIGVLLDYCGAMHTMYDTTPTFKYFSDNFFKKYAWNIEKMLNTLDLEYDPLKNMSVQWTETTDIEQNLDTEEGRQRQNTGTQGNSYTDNESKSFSHTDGSSYSENETNTISAMNSGTYQPDNKRDTSGNNSRNTGGTDTKNTTGSNTRTDNLNEQISATKGEDLSWDETDTHTETGTKGVAYQDLIQKERKQAEYNIYNWIAKKYAHELFLLVY